MTDPVELTAPAKLTVSLRVVGRREDGMHTLEAEMVTIDLADTLVLNPLPEDTSATLSVVGARLARASKIGPVRENLAIRALEAVGRTASVHIEKRIPIGGGLGGGSADAAAILRWAGCTDPEVAASLGADVPFCLVGGRAIARGIGDEVQVLAYVDRHFILLIPPFGVDTGAVYRAWDQLAADGQKRPEENGSGGGNDLTHAALLVEPRLRQWRDRFAEATGARPQLAGSGSTWFVEVDDEGLAAGDELTLDGESGLLMPVRTVPSGWKRA